MTDNNIIDNTINDNTINDNSNVIDNYNIIDKYNIIDNSIKNIIIHEKKLTTKKDKNKHRIETHTWGLSEIELSHDVQLKSLMIDNLIDNKNNYIKKIISHIKTKICSYKHQDLLKNKFNENEFVSLIDTIELLRFHNLKCCYCSNDVYILYEKVREMKQWSLDRINNDLGHNKGNLVIACLECNLKRRRTNKDAFMFTKNMILIKEY